MGIGRRSRYNRCTALKVVDANGVQTRRVYLDRFPRLRRVEFPDDRSYAVRRGDTWSALGFRLLGNSHDWWAIAEVNRVINPWEELEQFKDEGVSIRVPSISRVNFDFLAFGRNRLDL